MYKHFRDVIIMFLVLCFVPLVLADESINFTAQTDNATYLDRNYTFIEVTAISTNLTNLTIELFDSSGILINSTYTNESTLSINVTDLPDGLYYFNATANYTDTPTLNITETRNVTIDTAFPTIIFEPDTDNTSLVNRSYIIINITANDTNYANTTIYIYYINTTTNLVYINTTNTTNIYINYTATIDGLYHFNATTYDLAGHTSNTTTRNITIDTTAPIITFNTMNDSGETVSTSNLTFNITSSDAHPENITFYLYNATGEIINISTGTSSIYIEILNLTDGIYYYNATANDTLGHSSTSETKNITINTTMPTINYESDTDNAPFISRNYIQVNVTVMNLNLTNLTISIYNSSMDLINYSYTNATNLFANFTGLEDGQYYFNATARDDLGNNVSTEVRNITIDTTGPTIIFEPDTDNTSLVNRSYIVINVTANDIRLNYTAIYIYNSTGEIINTTTGVNTSIYINYTTISDGTYYYNATTYDTLGNENHTETRNITIDTTSPTITFNFPSSSGATINTSNITFNITITDAHFANMTLYLYNFSGALINNTTRNTSESQFIILNLTDGIYYYNATAYDTLGHITNETRNITIDTTAPSIIINNPTSTTYSTTTILINISSNGNYTWFYNGTANQTYTTTINITYTEGTHTLYAWTNDSAGNINSTNVTFTVDTTPPDTGGTKKTTTTSNDDYVYVPPSNNMSNDVVTFNQYWPVLVKGNRTTNLDMVGMPIVYFSISINTSANITNTLKIISQPSNPTNTSINASIYRYILINTTIRQYIDGINFKFKINRSWIAQHNLTNDNVTIYSYDNSWSDIGASKYSEDTGYIYYSSNITGIKNFAIGGPVIQQNELIKEEIIVEEIKLEDNITNIITTQTVNKKGFFKRVGEFLTNAKNNIHTVIANLSKETQGLIILTISSILILIIGVISGVLVYKNTIKPKIIRWNNRKIITGRIMPYAEEIPLTQPAAEQPSISVKLSEMPKDIPIMPDPEFNVRKVNELVLQCEYALDNGRIEEAKNYYSEARVIYFNSGLDYEQKSRVYTKLIELHNRLSK